MQLFLKEKAFSHFFQLFWIADKILNILNKTMTLISDVFLKLRTPKTVVMMYF